MDVPQTLGKYELRGTLGRGAMGVVYDGWDPLIARRVAIKSVPLPATPDPETAEEIARFRREAQAAGRLTHPNIVAVYDYGETADLAYIVMEYVDGPSLKGLLDKKERFPLDSIQRIMGDLLAGLQFSHERGVVHRDIKPANVMLTTQGQAKIADFGIARIEMSSMTQAGTMLGTPAYMSPEQFRGEAADARTDVYSSGVLLYQLLTGERPFEGGLTAIMHKALNTEPPAPSQLAGTVPRSVDAVVQKAMAKRPQDRFASAAAFAEGLRAAIARPDAAAPAAAADDEEESEATLVRPVRAPAAAAPPARPAAPPPPPPAPAPAGAAKKSQLPLFAGIGVVVVALAGGAGWFLTRPVPAPPAVQTADTTPVTPVETKPTAQAQPPATPETPPAPTPAVPTPTVPKAQPAEPTVAPVPTPPPPVATKPVEPPVTPPPPTTTTTSTTAPVEPPPPAVPVTTTQTTPAVQPPVAPPPATPVTPPPPPAPTQTALLLPQIAQALQATRCSLTEAVQQDGGGFSIHGYADATSAAALHTQVASLVGTQPVAWHVQTIEPVFCTALALLRPIHPLGGGPSPGVGLALYANRTVLKDGESILPRLTMPDFGGELRVDYLAHDGTMAHLYPTLADPGSKLNAQPSKKLSPGDHLALGDAGPGKPQWQSGEPYGTDMIIAVASSVPLRVSAPRNAEDSAEAYLAELAHAIEQARAGGAKVSGALLLVDAVPKPAK